MTKDAQYSKFVQALSLVGVALVECEAKRTGDADLASPLDVKLDLNSAHRLAPAEVDYRFIFDCAATQDGEDVATMTATFAASFVSERDHGGDPTLVSRFAQDVAVMAVYPYMREFMQSMAARLDIPNFTIGLAKRGELVIKEPGAE